MNDDKDKISDLWDEITPKLYGYLMNVLRDPVLADDIFQNTWLKAIEALPGFKDRGYGFSSWIFSIARNEMRMHWRKNGRNVEYDPILHDQPESDAPTEDKIFIQQIISQLSKEDQELIRLRYIADLTLKDIAKLLNFNPVTIRVKMHRALGRARIMLKTQNYE